MERAGVAKRLQEVEVGISLHASIHEGSTNFIVAELATNLLARLYPRLAIAGGGIDRLNAIAKAINPSIQLRDGESTGPRFTVGISDSSAAAISLAADGWDVIVNDDGPLNFNPYTAAAAACLGVGGIFRRIFRDMLPSSLQDRGGVWSLLDQQATRTAPQSARTTPATIDAALVGTGAIGQACLWMLDRAEVEGRVFLIDHEAIDAGNLQRYVLTESSDVGRKKTKVATRRLSSITGVEIPTSFDEASEVLDAADLVLAALDTARDRIAVQALLPRSIVNGWTQQTDLGVSVHRRFGQDPCLACLYWPTGPRPNLHEQLGGILKIHATRALAYLISRTPIGRPLTSEILTRLPARLDRPADAERWTEESVLSELTGRRVVREEDAAKWQDAPIDRFYREGVCGSANLQIDARLPEDHVPLAHQSALAGVLMAVAAVYPVVWREARLDVLRQLPTHFHVERLRTEGCICSDKDYIQRYQSKWGL